MCIPDPPFALSSDPAQDFDDLLEFLKHTRGFDFTGYKRASLTRRVDKRMQTVGISSYREFAQFLD
jgi:two-component system, chemotaxis family, CheB/CheR fusion protein